jgi:hypothetical protein
VNKNTGDALRGQIPVDFATGEGRVKEEANLYARYSLFANDREILILNSFSDLYQLAGGEVGRVFWARDKTSEKHRKEHEMVVLDPDHRARLDLLADNFCESHVSLAVGQPVLFVKVHFSGVVVKQRPEYGVGEAVVVPVSDVIVEVDSLA